MATNEGGNGMEAPFFHGMHPYFRVDDVSETHVKMDHHCSKMLHVQMPVGAPRDGSLIPNRETTTWFALNGSDALGGTREKPTYLDHEFKAADSVDRCPMMKTEIADGQGTSVLWQDANYRFTQIFTGAMELWGDSAVAFEPMSAKADAFNNFDRLSILSDGETFSGAFGFFVL